MEFQINGEGTRCLLCLNKQMVGIFHNQGQAEAFVKCVIGDEVPAEGYIKATYFNLPHMCVDISEESCG